MSATEKTGSTAAMDAVGEETLEIFAENDAYNRFLWRTLTRQAPALGDVLEVGSGIGNITKMILAEDRVDTVHGLDMDPAYVERMMRELDDPRLTGTAATMEEFSAENFDSAQDASYDTIVCSNVLEHIEDHVAAMREFHRLLRPGGSVLLLVPAHAWLFCTLDTHLSHFRRYCHADFVMLSKEANFALESCRHFNPLGILGWWLNGKVLRRSVLPAGQMSAYAKLAIPVSKLIDATNPFPLGISITGVFRKSS